jgi:predicted nucleotidyltransferase
MQQLATAIPQRERNKRFVDSDPREVLHSLFFTYIDSSLYSIFIFGSRAKGEARKNSDRDIGILGNEPVSREVMREIYDACDQLPYRVDVVDFSGRDDTFSKLALMHQEDL